MLTRTGCAVTRTGTRRRPRLAEAELLVDRAARLGQGRYRCLVPDRPGHLFALLQRTSTGWPGTGAPAQPRRVHLPLREPPQVLGLQFGHPLVVLLQRLVGAVAQRVVARAVQ